MDASYAVGGDKQRALRRSAGRRCRSVVTSSDKDRDRTAQTDLCQCVHCGAHWQHVAGSGKLRGYCARCDGPFCGPPCQECVPIEQVLENMEAGMPFAEARRHRPVRASAGGVVLGG